jgi:anti-anti-sigma factor
MLDRDRSSNDAPQVGLPKTQVLSSDRDGVIIVTVIGELDVASAPLLEAALAAVGHEPAIAVDLCRCDFVDSSGLSVLLGYAAGRPHALVVARRPDGPVDRLFRLTGVEATEAGSLRCYESLSSAIEALSRISSEPEAAPAPRPGPYAGRLKATVS